MQRYEQIGVQIMNRAGSGGALGSDPLAGVLGDRDKRAFAAQLLGQAYVTAYALISHNKKAVEQIAEALIEKKELFGDELVEILESAKLKIPQDRPHAGEGVARGLGTRGRFAVAYLLLGAAVGIAVGGADRARQPHRPAARAAVVELAADDLVDLLARVRDRAARRSLLQAANRRPAGRGQGRRLPKRQRLRRCRDRQAERSALARQVVQAREHRRLHSLRG